MIKNNKTGYCDIFELTINIYIYTQTKVKHHPIFLSIYFLTSILLNQ